MTTEERIRAISEKQIQLPETTCQARISEVQSIRKIRYRRLMEQLNGLTEQERELLIAQWEA